MDQNTPNGARVVRPAAEQQVDETLGPLDWCGHVPQGDADEASVRLARSEAQGWQGRAAVDAAAMLRQHADELDALSRWLGIDVGELPGSQPGQPGLTAAQMRVAAQLVEDLAGPPRQLPRRRRLQPGLMGQMLDVAHRQQREDAGPVDVQFVIPPRGATVRAVGDAALSAEGMDDLRQRVGAARQELAGERPGQRASP